MANNENLIPIPGRLHSVATEGHVAGADEIYDDTQQKDQETINSELIQAVGTGGSVDSKIATAKAEIIGDAASDYNTLGKLEDKIQAEAARAGAAEADRYTKSETYTKEEVHNLITTPSQEYVSVTATAQTTAVTDVLPATGAADTTYRVGNWDGTQYNDSVFSEYAWNGTAYIKLSTKSQVGEIYDISANHADTKYADLAAALGTSGANIPQSLQKGGMSVKFVQTSDNKYIQARCMAQNFTTDVTQWQGVDDEPTADSDNLVKSGGVADSLLNIDKNVEYLVSNKVFNINTFANDSTQYITYDGYTLTNTALDTRVHTGYTIRLIKGKQYAVIYNNIDSMSVYFNFMEKTTLEQVNVYPEYAYEASARIFQVPATGDYELKLFGHIPTNIDGFDIVEYEEWFEKNTIGVLPDFDNSSDDTDAINKAILRANSFGFYRVVVPYKELYTLPRSIEMLSNVELYVCGNTRLKLADQECTTEGDTTTTVKGNCPMIVNKHRTTSGIGDYNIKVTGGIWDGNSANQSKRRYFDSTNFEYVVGMNFVGVKGITFENVSVVDTKVYGLLFGNSSNINIYDSEVNVGDILQFGQNCDGIHFLGPCKQIKIIDCIVKSEDGCIAVNADDTDHGIFTTRGPIDDVIIKNISINNNGGSQGIQLVSTSSAITNVDINTIHGTAGYLINISCFGIISGQTGQFKNIRVQNVSMDIAGTWPTAVILWGSILDLHLENIYLNYIDYETPGGKNFIQTRMENGCTTTINNLVVKNCKLRTQNSGKVYTFATVSAGTAILNLIVDTLQFIDNLNYIYPIIVHGMLVNLNVLNCIFDNVREGLIVFEEDSTHSNYLNVDNIALDFCSSPRILVKSNGNLNVVFIGKVLTGHQIWIDDAKVNALYIERTLNPVVDNYDSDTTCFYSGELRPSKANDTSIGWKCVNSGFKYSVDRQPNTTYSANTCRRYGDYLLVCVTGGTTSIDEEITVNENVEFYDGSVQWRVLYKDRASFVQV